MTVPTKAELWVANLVALLVVSTADPKVVNWVAHWVPTMVVL